MAQPAPEPSFVRPQARAPQPQPPRFEPMQEHYPESDWEVQTNPDTGQRLLIIQVPLPRKVLIFPMDAAKAAERGLLLSAPSVVRPG